MSDERSFEQLKYDLEKQKLEFEQRKYERDNTFFNKNFGVIITGLVSLATIVVSGSGLLISRNYNASQLDNAINESDRKFSFDVAKFLLEKREDINTADTLKAGYARNIVISLFPDTLSAQISRRMRDLSGDSEVKQVWADGLVYAQSIATPPAGGPTGATTTPATSQTSPAKTSNLTAEALANEFKQLSGDGKLEELKLILAEANKNKIADKNDIAIFLTAVFTETNFLQVKQEPFNFSAQRLQMIWPSRFSSPEQAKEFENNPEKIANLVYGGRMGNVEPSDGFKFRGRGYLMTTGRDAYRRLGAALDLDLVAKPEAILESQNNARAAALEFVQLTEPLRKAGNLDLVKTSVAVTGGIFGLDQKRATYDRIMKL